MKHALLTISFAALSLLTVAPRPTRAQAEVHPELLQVAHQSEVSAMWKYRVHAEVARREGHLEVAAYFSAMACAESIHAGLIRTLIEARGGVPKDYVQGFQLGNTAANLERSALGEHEEWVSIYPVLRDVAQRGQDYRAADVFRYATSAEASHESLFVEAHVCLSGNPHRPKTPVHICGECGRASLERPKVNCPCGIASRKFLKFE